MTSSVKYFAFKLVCLYAVICSFRIMNWFAETVTGELSVGKKKLSFTNVDMQVRKFVPQCQILIKDIRLQEAYNKPVYDSL